MKTAKEWAESVVGEPYEDGGRWHVDLRDEDDYVPLERQSELGVADSIGADASGIIERLVERVQADARAPLEEEIARLREERERDIAAVEALVDATTGEEDPRVVKAVDILIQRINAWRAEQP